MSRLGRKLNEKILARACHRSVDAPSICGRTKVGGWGWQGEEGPTWPESLQPGVTSPVLGPPGSWPWPHPQAQRPRPSCAPSSGLFLTAAPPETGDRWRLAGGHLLGQAPARLSGWARPQQRCPRQRWAPWKAGCQLDSLWASDRPPGRIGWWGEGGRPGRRGFGQGHETREESREQPGVGRRETGYLWQAAWPSGAQTWNP